MSKKSLSWADLHILRIRVRKEFAEANEDIRREFKNLKDAVKSGDQPDLETGSEFGEKIATGKFGLLTISVHRRGFVTLVSESPFAIFQGKDYSSERDSIESEFLFVKDVSLVDEAGNFLCLTIAEQKNPLLDTFTFREIRLPLEDESTALAGLKIENAWQKIRLGRTSDFALKKRDSIFLPMQTAAYLEALKASVDLGIATKMLLKTELEEAYKEPWRFQL